MSNKQGTWKEFWKIGVHFIDLPLVYLIFILLFSGLAILYSASSVVAQRDFEDSLYYVKKQAIWLGISFVAMLVASIFPLKLLEKYAGLLMLTNLVLLGLVFVPFIGKSVETHYGRTFHRWLNLGFLQFQPSELAKVTIVIYVSAILVKVHETEFHWKSFGTPIFFAGLALALIMAEPAFGTFFEILLIILILVYVYGFQIQKLFLGFLSILPLLGLLVYKVGYRKKRIEVWLDPYKYRYDEGHQLVSSFRSFYEGGFWGNPLASGYSHRYLTYSHTDFILPTFVEDFGYLGFLILMSLFLILIIRVVLLLKRLSDPFYLLLGIGLVSLITLQILINSFVVTGLLPITGISFPLLSYGGSSLLTIMLSFGLLINITKKENLS